jgi:DNA-binding winged helix-turn-helix (wHTH) protein
MAHAHTAALGALITGVLQSGIALDRRDAHARHRTIPRVRVQLTKPQFLLSDRHARRISTTIRSEWSFAVVKTFGHFEFDDRRRALRADGRPVRLNGQALDVLSLLLERPGELITREEIEGRLWPDRHVDVAHGLDVVVSRLRTVLGDRGASPRYIETIPRKGYRFIEPVVARPEGAAAHARGHWSRRIAAYAAVAILAAMVAILFAHTRYDKFVPPHRSPASPTAPGR